MYKKLTLIFLLTSILGFGQEKFEKIEPSKISEVTVFLKNAEVHRTSSIDLEKGITEIKFNQLSPYIISRSVKVKGDSNITILDQRFVKEYSDSMDKFNSELLQFKNQIDQEKLKLEKFELKISILQNELDFLKSNQILSGKNEALTVSQLSAAANYFSKSMNDKLNSLFELKQQVATQNELIDKLNTQIKNISPENIDEMGVVILKVETEKVVNSKIELSYIVENASWFPSYDIRGNKINEPIEIDYFANVKQDTKVNWDNVKLTFSSINPDISATAPELIPHYLNYGSFPPTYGNSSDNGKGIVSGMVSDDSGPLPGVQVKIVGTTIGTETDFDGKFSLAVPDGNHQLQFNYIGMQQVVRPIDNSKINVVMETENLLEEVVVVGYGISGAASGLKIREDSSIRSKENIDTDKVLPFVTSNEFTSVNYTLNKPFSVESKTTSSKVRMTKISLEADYEYYSVPKINNNVYLKASILDWNKHNLLDGEASIFFENSFIGKTTLNTNSASDTLTVSMGVDKKINISREKVKELSSQNFIGSKKEEVFNYRIQVQNMKNSDVEIKVYDQFPVSQNKEIKIELLETSNGQINSENGEILWILNLEPSDKNELNFGFSIRYPKYRTLRIE